ncbi:MAG TPA: OmpA family protein [Thermoanaerobaculia bacterium]|nr:OmpA family protein [Thermoanaerobaculia bacterium]
MSSALCHEKRRNRIGAATIALASLLAAGCSMIREERQPYTTKRDNIKKGAGIGAAAGAAGALLAGKREGDELLAGAAVGAAAGAGVGWYLDRQEEKLARIPGTWVERAGKNTLLVRFESDVLFGVDSAMIDSRGRSVLEQVAGVLAEFPKTTVIVQGHTDSTGSEEHNQHLSERRAGAVRGVLVGRGVAPARVTSLGFGESDPVASNTTVSGRQQNRRVDIMLRANAT